MVGNYLATQPAHEMEKEHLLQTLQRNEWNVARVARKLGLGRPTIYARMQRYGIERKKVPKTLKRIPVES
jgi:transcriptional regulator of acetoin/glycerol metabolism